MKNYHVEKRIQTSVDNFLKKSAGPPEKTIGLIRTGIDEQGVGVRVRVRVEVEVGAGVGAGIRVGAGSGSRK